MYGGKLSLGDLVEVEIEGSPSVVAAKRRAVGGERAAARSCARAHAPRGGTLRAGARVRTLRRAGTLWGAGAPTHAAARGAGAPADAARRRTRRGGTRRPAGVEIERRRGGGRGRPHEEGAAELGSGTRGAGAGAGCALAAVVGLEVGAGEVDEEVELPRLEWGVGVERSGSVARPEVAQNPNPNPNPTPHPSSSAPNPPSPSRKDPSDPTPASSAAPTAKIPFRPRKIRKVSGESDGDPSSSSSSARAALRAAARPLSADGEVAAAIRHLRAADPLLAPVIDVHEPPIFERFHPPFHCLVRSILYQQLAYKAAASIYARFLSLRARRRSTSTTRRKYHSGILSDAAIVAMDDKSLFSMLTMVNGIGAWSVHMFMIFSLHRPDVLPVGDLGVRKGADPLRAQRGAAPSQMEQYCDNGALPLRRRLVHVAPRR
ncbi:hypothetical protein ACMD2_15619 [Ananas comosus]|uniref:HhH-GPD domain-containing protein n=1 Tax=Ananas comosus TaxID=4615 RepID=A0A199ULX6_ANACO|nr:hypothetical protein ACMD2_15619 [Ananas comosus]